MPSLSYDHLEEEDLPKDEIELSCKHECSLLYKEKETSNAVLRQLSVVFVLCIFFMLAEIIGGIIANSLAILADGAHLGADAAGYLISILAVWYGQKGQTSKFTYGYARVEIIGALVSILILWLILFLLFFEGVHRIKNPEDVDSTIMLYISTGGFLVNIIMGCVLISCGHGHSHGLQKCDGSHGHAQFDFATIDISHGEVNTDSDSGGGILSQSEHGHLHGSKPCTHSHGHGSPKSHAHGHGHHSESHSSHGHGHGARSCSHHSHSKKASSHGHGHGGKSCSHGHGHGSPKAKAHGHSHASGACNGSHSDSQIDVLTSRPFSPKLPKENINVRAAFIHVVADALQSFGVVVSSTLIYFDKEKFLLADPLCTMLFAFLGLAFSLPTMRDIFRIILLAVPDEVDVDHLKSDLLAIDSRIEGLHCFHLWTLNVDSFAMTCHILTRSSSLNTASFLKKVQAVCTQHGVEHTVVQIELLTSPQN